MISDELRATLRRLFYAEHWKIGTLAEQHGIHHETVRRAIETDRFSGRGAVRPSALDPYLEVVADTLRQYPRLTATRLHEMLTARGYRGSIGQLRRRIHQLGLRPRRTPEAFFRLTTAPGEQGQVDWGHFGRIRIGGAQRPLYFFVVVLSWSRAVHVDFSLEQTMAAVMRGHRRAFEALGGCPRQLLYDNMKTVVIERVGDAIRFHPRLLELAGHYHFAPRPCRPGRGNEKGRVERRIRDLRTSFFAGRQFVDIEDLRRQFELWRQQIANQRPHPDDATLTVGQAWERERAYLLPLPQNPIDTDEVRAVTVPKQPYVRYDKNRYSVPHTLVGKGVTLAASDTCVRILDGSHEVARHARCWGAGVVIEDPVHIEGLQQIKRKALGATGRERLLAAVPMAETLYAELAARQEPMARETTALLGLLDRYGGEALAAAVAEALARGTPRAASIAHLLTQAERRRPRKPATALHFTERPDIAQLTVRNHNLEDYDELTDKTP